MSTSSLASILARRKQQISTTLDTIDLRPAGGAADSDDEDGDEDASTGTGAVINGAAANNPSIALLLSRASNVLSAGSTDEKKKMIGGLEEANLTADQLAPLLQSLLLRFSDPSERCRSGTIGLFSRWQQQSDSSDVSGSLPFLVPVMVERLGSEGTREPSEEVRATLVTLMRDVLTKCKALIRPYTAEVGAIALGCCRDQHPEVIKGLCELLATISSVILQPLCRENGGKQVKPFSTKLIEAVLPHIRHRHGPVRLQVLGALEELILCGAGQSVETVVGWRLKNNVPIAEFYGKGEARINYLADLSRDRNVNVRRALAKTVARWCREMDGEDLYEQEVRIMPYLISSLTDEDAETARLAKVEIDRLGDLYLEKEWKEYKERVEYGHADEKAETAAITLKGPKPIDTRPPLGARERIRTHFRHLIHPICKELELWTSTERYQSAKLLEVLLVYTEAAVTEFAHQLLPCLAKGKEGDTPGLPEAVGKCAAQFAQHMVEPADYLPLLISHARHDPLNTFSQRVNFVRLIPDLLGGMRPATCYKAVPQLQPLMIEANTITSQHTKLREAVSDALKALIAAAALAAESVQSSSAPPPYLLYAIISFVASDVKLQPKVTSVEGTDGLEDIEEAPEEEWEMAMERALALATPPSSSAEEGQEEEVAAAAEVAKGSSSSRPSAWRVRGKAVRRMMEAAKAAEEDHAEAGMKLLERVVTHEGGEMEGGAGAGAGGDAASALVSPMAAASVAAAAVPAAAAAAGAKKAVVIDEGDFSDDEVEAGGGGIDEFEDELD